ncbi:MAG: response regulator transcription factor [Gammaproteobacteria bacterium]|nr:response regulator transcription factor [Gammaproteobacteria bacterium]
MSTKTRILIIEDEAPIRNGLVDLLVFHGYAVDWAEEGRDGLRKALTGGYQLILLDIMLPGVNGFEICNRVREADREQPIIMLTARSTDDDIIHGLSLGADDYVTKPFSVTELVWRIKAVLRRTLPDVGTDRIRLGGNLEIDCLNLSGRQGEVTFTFTRREMDLLRYLAVHSARPVSREELLSKVWGYGRTLDLETRTVDIHVAKLRRKLEPQPAQPRYLVTVRGAGYRLLVDDPVPVDEAIRR